MSKCNPNYKNLNLIQSFSDQRYVTVQLMEQACMNDEWLRQQVKSLDYQVPPSYRKRFSPILLDAVQSWGCVISTDKEVIFNNSTSDRIDVDFDENMFRVDEMQSTCDYETFTSGDDDNKTIKKRAVLHTQEITEEFTGEKCLNQNRKVNSFWYVGYDKNQPYETRPDWLKNWRDLEIPSIVRAQTIKVAKTGYVSSISIALENTGVKGSNWGSPLYIQIQNCVKKTVKKTKWNAKTKKSEIVYKADGTTPETETVYYPVASPHKPLAVATYNPNHTTPDFISVPFDKPVKLLKNHHYAICFYSPLSHPDHCPRIGGWGRNCHADKYANGDAFLSEKNGRAWIRYGKNDTKVDYKFGKWTPLDFCFQLNMFNKHDNYLGGGEDNAEYLYLKPILSNPITHLDILATDTGDTDGDVHVKYEVSTNGRNWSEISKTNGVDFFNPTHMIFVRAKLWRDTSATTKTPNIESMTLLLTTNPAEEFYARTLPYPIKTAPMLGASHWGRIYAPFECDPQTECTVEIIREEPVKDNFTIITAEDLPTLPKEFNLDETKINSDDMSVRYQYLIDNPDIIDLLISKHILVKPYTDSGGTVHPFGWWATNSSGQRIGGIQLSDSPAYPMLECIVEPASGDTFSLSEWADYTVNYDDDLILFEVGIINELPPGALTVTYTPVFIQDLTLDEVGDWIDNETGLPEKGLILDYFKETIEVTSEHIANRSVPLRVSPLDPIKEVVIIRDDGDTEIELFEDIDFTIDYAKKQILFPIVNINNSSPIIQLEDVVQIVYTPNLPDTMISIGYRAKRTNLNNQVRIKSNYLEYKV